jgi:hypothetical protein
MDTTRKLRDDKWRAAHPEKRRESNRQWREANRSKAREASKRWRESNKDSLREYMRKRSSSEYFRDYRKAYLARRDVRMLVLITQAKGRAKRNGMAFEDGVMRFRAAPPDRCACCGAALDYSTTIGRDTSRSPSLDRVDNTKGYTTGNTCVICARCNLLKRDASLREVEQILAYMRLHSPTV